MTAPVGVWGAFTVRTALSADLRLRPAAALRSSPMRAWPGRSATASSWPRALLRGGPGRRPAQRRDDDAHASPSQCGRLAAAHVSSSSTSTPRCSRDRPVAEAAMRDMRAGPAAGRHRSAPGGLRGDGAEIRLRGGAVRASCRRCRRTASASPSTIMARPRLRHQPDQGLKPDIVKFDAKWITRLMESGPGFALLAAMVSSFGEQGIHTVFEGIEEAGSSSLPKRPAHPWSRASCSRGRRSCRQSSAQRPARRPPAPLRSPRSPKAPSPPRSPAPMPGRDLSAAARERLNPDS